MRFSDTRDWTPLARARAPHYTADYPLPAEWEARVEAIALAHATPEARAFAALRLVQDELRYVSLSVGAGGYFARSPVEVIAARTGKLVLQGGGKGHHTDRAVAVALAYLQTERLQKSYVGIGKVRGYW